MQKSSRDLVVGLVPTHARRRIDYSVRYYSVAGLVVDFVVQSQIHELRHARQENMIY